MSIDINKEIEELDLLGLLPMLLKDKTTGGNIIWASDLYASNGPEYSKENEITRQLIIRGNLIKTRFNKEESDQQNRTKKHAEVFTPIWVCNKMINALDEDWFGYSNVFNNGKTPTDRVNFPENKKWTAYVDSRRLEITCGEAPFLVNRYDTETGGFIPIKKRIGLLDRKLRVVDENTKTEKEWLEWAFRAFESIYGYEFQGDNVLIARINLLKTFEEYLQSRWKRKPTLYEYKKLINIIVWNIWQMDGLTGLPPYKAKTNKVKQVSIFDTLSTVNDNEKKVNNSLLCQIYNWRSKKREYFSNN